jgi:hypothetical protein
MNKLPLKESLFLGFCAVFIVLARSALKLHLHIAGHAMFLTMFFLLIARGCVRYTFAATITGLLAGALALVLGVGRLGPAILTGFVLPAFIVDLSALILPRMFQSYLQCALVGALAPSVKFVGTYIVDLMVVMDKEIIIKHALVETAGAVLFGLAGSLFVPPVIRKLRAYGVV